MISLPTVKWWRTVFPLRKIHIEQNISFSAHAIAQPCRHTNGEAFQALTGLCDIKFGMLQVRENEISPRKRSGITGHLRSCAP